jgi:hypothetical protein
MKSYMVEIFPAVLAIVLLGLSLLALMVMFETARWRWQVARAGNGTTGLPRQDQIDDRQSAQSEHSEAERLPMPSVADGESERNFIDLDGHDARPSCSIRSDRENEVCDFFAPDQTESETEQLPGPDKDSNAQQQDLFRGPVTQRSLAADDAGEGRDDIDQDKKQRRRARKAEKRGPAGFSDASDMPRRRGQGKRQSESPAPERERARRRAKRAQEPDEVRGRKRQSRPGKRGE